MFSAIARIFRTPDLRKKIGFTIALIALFRLGSFIPAPFVDYVNVQACLAGGAGTTGLYDLVNLFSGGALLQLSVFALGIMPYITASIIVQLLRVVIPHFDDLYKEGQAGQATLTQYTRYLTIGLGILQSTTLVTVARSGALFPTSTGTPECSQLLTNDQWYAILLMVITMTAGNGLIMWMGELITERGVGNGMSLLIFISIAATFPSALWGIAVAKSFEVFLMVVDPRTGDHRLWSSTSNSRSAASPCNTPNGWSDDERSAATTPTSRSRSTWPGSSRSSSPRRCCTCRR